VPPASCSGPRSPLFSGSTGQGVGSVDWAQRRIKIEIGFCAPRPILQPCSLEGHTVQIDPYVGCEHHCLYCYALNGAESDWRQRILIHSDLERRLIEELEGVAPKSIYMGMNSDPYQPIEAVCVLTKSSLIARDVDLFQRIRDPY